MKSIKPFVRKVIFFIIRIAFFPFRYGKNAIFRHRFNKAKQRADEIHAERGCKVYVIQTGMSFFVGTRADLRRRNKLGNKVVKRKLKTHLADYDYKNAIIYVSNNN